MKTAGTFLPLMVGALFLSLFLILAFHNRAASDDLYCISILNEKGFWGSVSMLFNNLGGRWASYAFCLGLLNLPPSMIQLPWVIFIYHVCFISLLIYSISTIIKQGLIRIGVDLPGKAVLVSFALIFIGCFFFMTFQLIEAWWWVVGSFAYTLGAVFASLILASILRPGNKWVDFLLIGISALYLGGTAEIWPIPLIVALVVWLVFSMVRQKKDFLKLNNKALIALAVMLFAFSINISSIGTSTRIKTQDNSGSVTFVEKSIEEVGRFSKHFFVPKTLLSILLSANFFLFGSLLWSEKRSLEMKNHLRKVLKYGSLCLLLWMIVVFSPLVIVVGDLGPPRAWTSISYLIAMYLCLLAFFLGISTTPWPLTQYLRIVLPALCSVILINYIARQAPMVSKYANAYDERLSYLLEQKARGNKNTLTIQPLPPSGMLVSGNYWAPSVWIKALDLDFKLLVAGSPEKQSKQIYPSNLNDTLTR